MIRILAFSLLLALSACSLLGSDNDPEIHYFVAQVNSISVPASIRASDTLTVFLYGWLGNSGCYGFERFEAEREPSRLELAVIGSVVDAEICTTVMVPVPPKYDVVPPLEGPFELVIRQPGGSTLERTVEVVEE